MPLTAAALSLKGWFDTLHHTTELDTYIFNRFSTVVPDAGKYLANVFISFFLIYLGCQEYVEIRAVNGRGFKSLNQTYLSESIRQFSNFHLLKELDKTFSLDAS